MKYYYNSTKIASPSSKGETVIYFCPRYKGMYFTYVNKITITHDAIHLLNVILKDAIENYDKYCNHTSSNIVDRHIRIFSPYEEVTELVRGFFESQETDIRWYTHLISSN